MSLERKLNIEDLKQYGEYLGTSFIQRRDLYARQLSDGRYVCIRESLTDELLCKHLAGELTLGAYVLNEQSHSRFLVFDADDEPNWRRLRALSRALEEMDTPTYLENSRRGGHLWLFFESWQPGKELRQFGTALMEHFRIEGVELFPKQSVLTSGPGSLIRLPFGIHQKTGRRYGFTTPRGEPLGLTLRDQIEWLALPECVPEAMWRNFESQPTVSKRETVATGRELSLSLPEGTPLSVRIKNAESVSQFVSRYVELSSAGLGLCPFHDDQVESFSVNEEENYWHCFACGTGGSIIDFWIQQQQVDFQTAIKELAQLLLN